MRFFVVTFLFFSFNLFSQDNADSLKTIFNNSSEIKKIELLNNLTSIYIDESNWEEAEASALKSIDLSIKLENDSLLIQGYQKLGLVFYHQSSYAEALNNWKKSLEIAQQSGQKSDEALMLNNIGVIYRQWGDFKTAIQYYQQALEIQEDLGDKENIAKSLSNIGNVYYDYGVDYEKALDYYNQGMDLFQELGDTIRVAYLTNNIGFVLKELKQYDEAQKKILESLTLFRSLNHLPGIANALHNLVDINIIKNEYKQAINNLKEAEEIYVTLNDKLNLALNYQSLAKTYIEMKDFNKALFNLDKGYELANELGIKNDLIDFYAIYSDIYKKTGNYKKSLEYFEYYSELKDTVFREDYLEQIAELQTKYETKEKEQEIELQKAEIAQKNLENKRQKILILSIGLGFVLILLFSALLYKQFREKKKANALLREQNLEIKNQRDQIYEQKRAITDSIKYASKIQTALLPPYENFHGEFSECFLLFKPKDIVSGDFYWTTKKDSQTVIAAVDCTGHGVPGAFMSMLGVAFLNEIVNSSKELKANEILNELRIRVVTSLHQTGREGESQDGMDIALCVVDKDNSKLQFAGAFNPLVVVRNKEITVLPGDKMPIGIFRQGAKEFKNNVVEIQEGDAFYIFSDGYADQFGGKSKKKFLIKRLKELLSSISDKTMSEQKELLEQNFTSWKGNYRQIDDVLVIGFRV